MTTATLRDGTTTQDRRLDRLVEFDERSRAFPVSATIPAQAIARSRSHPLGLHLDQGAEGACVEFGLCHEMAASPVRVAEAIVRAITREHAIYYPAQRDDPWPGGSYPGASPVYEGTSVLSGLKRVVALGYATGYRWCFGLADVVMALGNKGPVVFGLVWMQGMASPDARGFITATGASLGGHCVLGKAIKVVWKRGTTAAMKREPRWLDYVDLDASFVTLHQSWGTDHGDGGDVYLSLRDLGTLLGMQGEAAYLEGRRATVRVAA